MNYNLIDEVVMAGVNSGVKAWNWATGGNKESLINTLCLINIMNCISLDLRQKDPSRITDDLLNNSILYCANTFVSNQEKDENKTKDFFAHLIKNGAKGIGYAITPIALATSTLVLGYYVSGESERVGNLREYLIPAFETATLFILNADYLPPRKNVLIRFSDKVKSWYSKLEERSNGVPEPAYRKYHLNKLENKLSSI
ncbi:MAG: hypothetical protein AABX11_04105 [Nanoarchaeota archaeon]